MDASSRQKQDSIQNSVRTDIGKAILSDIVEHLNIHLPTDTKKHLKRSISDQQSKELIEEFINWYFKRGPAFYQLIVEQKLTIEESEEFLEELKKM